MTAEQFGRMHPSNRTFIEQCKRWGAIVHRSSGEWTTLRLPNRALVDVRSEQCHAGNPRKTMNEVVSALGVNLAEFWQGPQVGMVLPATEAPAGNIIAAQRKAAALIDEAAPSDEIRAALADLRASADNSVAELYVDDDAVEQVLDGLDEIDEIERQFAAETQTGGPDMAVTEVIPIRSPRVHLNRGLTNRVFDLLVDCGTPLSCAAIADRLDVQGVNRNTSVSNACGSLVRAGVARRVKMGVYASIDTKPAEHTVAVRVSTEHEHGGATPAPPRIVRVPQAVIDEVAALDAPPWPEQGESPAGGFEPQRPSLPTVESIDDEVDTVLDLLFPHGMNVRAADLRPIHEWVEQTKALLRRVRS